MAYASWASCITPMLTANGPTYRDSDVGRLDKVLDEANAQGWTVVDMKRDWNVVFPTEEL